MIRRTSVLAAFVLAWIGTCATGQELTTNAERDWKAIRNSDDVRTQRMAERWFNAVRQQDWNDASGKFKVSAKYLEHDPNLTWVKLRVIRGTGKERVVKDVQISLEKLSKTCQARVRTISVLAEKIAEAKEAEAKKEAEEETNDAAGGRGGETRGDRSLEQGEMPEEPRGERGGFDAGLAGMDPREVVAQSESTPGDRGRGGLEQPPVVTNDGPPLPALVPGLPSEATASPPAAAPPATDSAPAAESTGGGDWRTRYDAFRSNIRVQGQRDELVFNWGPMAELQNAYDVNKRHQESGSIGREAFTEIAAALQAIGEVQWEATLQETPTETSDWNAVLGLAQPGEAKALSFELDVQNDHGPWQQMKAGDRVRFIGRFDRFDGKSPIVVAIRFPADQAGTAAAAPQR